MAVDFKKIDLRFPLFLRIGKARLATIIANLVFLCYSFGQGGSFQLAMKPIGKKHNFDIVTVNENNDAIAFLNTQNFNGIYTNEFYLNCIGKSDTMIFTRFTVPNTNNQWLKTEPKALYFGDQVVFSYAGNMIGHLLHYDVQKNTVWFKRFDDVNGQRRSLKSFTKGWNDELIALIGWGFDNSQYPGFEVLRLFSLDENGNVLWKKDLKMAFPGINIPLIKSAEITYDPFSETYFITAGIVDNSIPPIAQLVMRVDKTGKPLLWKTIDTHIFEEIYTHEGSIYLLGRTKQDVPFSTNNENAILCKMDSMLTPIWARCYSGERFNYNTSNLNFLPIGDLTLAYSTTGKFPTILAKLDDQGQVLGMLGYPLFEPQLDVLSDGSLIMVTNESFDSTGAVFHQPIIAQTNPDGLIDGCEVLPACLNDGQIDIAFGDFSIEEISDSTVIWDELVVIDTITFLFDDFCGTPPAPSAEFYLPDSLCFGSKIEPSNLNSLLATYRRWRVTSPDSIVSFHQSLSPLWFQPKTPGSYKIAQQIWFLGCTYEYERNLTLLPPLSVKIQPDSLICGETPAELFLQSNRSLTSFEWSTGAATPNISINDDGLFWVKTSDGFCEAIDTAQISFLLKKLDGQPPLDLPMDTAVCQQNLPFELKPGSLFTKTFNLKKPGSPLSVDSTFWLNSPGLFEVTAEIEGCLFSKKFTLAVSGCDPKIYFPTAFSPDGDGLNDAFFPQGEGFRSLKLTIFDRWGNIWFEDSSSSPIWFDQRAMPGVFTYLFEFENLLNGSKGRLAGSVSVAK